jgi:beta-phosphoglucomutase
MLLKGALFDLDGVLVSTDEYHFQSWKKMTDAEGIAFDRKVNHRLRGVSRLESLNIILEEAGVEVPEEKKSALTDRKNEYYRELLKNLTPESTLPGAREMLTALRERGVKIAVASSSKNARSIVAQIGIADMLDAIVDGTEIENSKPDPEVFLKAAERVGLKPSECVVIEDAEAGIEAAKAAGMKFVGVGDREGLPNADGRVVASLADIAPEALLQ